MELGPRSEVAGGDGDVGVLRLECQPELGCRVV
jgi:hypothetical protein